MEDPQRQFDFWVGAWDCLWDGGRGRNTVEWTCAGRVLQESFDAGAGGLIGASISLYDETAGCWVQTWMDSQGSWFHLTGRWDGRAMELLTTTPDHDGLWKRMRFAGIEEDGFDWTWSGSSDRREWHQLWAISYRRMRA